MRSIRLPLRFRLPFAAILLVALAWTGISRAADEVTIYRCASAGGKISLQDRPCPKDAHQDIRQMIRPQDPPPRPQSSTVQAPPAASPAEVRIVHVRDSQPTYQCTTPDGDTYINHTGIPQARYVPLWTFGIRRGNGFENVGRPTPQPSPNPVGRRPPHGLGFPLMAYVEDSCVRLQQDEVCQSLRARNDVLGTLIFNGQPSDRERYERERRGLLEQMQSDCIASD
jgi:hypothetical protein